MGAHEVMKSSMCSSEKLKKLQIKKSKIMLKLKKKRGGAKYASKRAWYFHEERSSKNIESRT